MNILICFKVGPDLDKVADSDWGEVCRNPGADLSYAGRVLGCFDESALEVALRLKEAGDALGQPVRCTALTLGQKPPAPVWQSLYAAGLDEVVVAEGDHHEFRPGAVALELAAYAKENAFDLILTGRQAGLGDTATVPYLLGELLGLPVLGDAELVTLDTAGLRVTRTTHRGRERLTVQPPLVVSIGNSPAAALRAVTLRSKLAAAKRQVTAYPAQPLDWDCPTLHREEVLTQCSYWEGEPAELAARVADTYMGEVRG